MIVAVIGISHVSGNGFLFPGQQSFIGGRGGEGRHIQMRTIAYEYFNWNGFVWFVISYWVIGHARAQQSLWQSLPFAKQSWTLDMHIFCSSNGHAMCRYDHRLRQFQRRWRKSCTDRVSTEVRERVAMLCVDRESSVSVLA